MPNRLQPDLLTENKLIHGWRTGAPKVRIRQAGERDISALANVAQLADTPLEDRLREAIIDGSAGAALRAGLRAGYDAYLRHMAERFAELQRRNPMIAYLDAALILVAEHRDNGVVGGLIAHPPVNVPEQVIAWMQQAGLPDQKLHEVMLLNGTQLIRIKALGVFEHARGSNLGGSLLKWCKQVYFHCRYDTLYGMMPSTPGLDQFYRRAGFDVQDYGEPLDLSILFGVPADISPSQTERIFLCIRRTTD